MPGAPFRRSLPLLMLPDLAFPRSTQAQSAVHLFIHTLDRKEPIVLKQSRWLINLLVIVAILIVAACGGGSAPAPAEEAAPAQEEAQATEPAEQEAAAPAEGAAAASGELPTGAVEYPEPPELDLGGEVAEPLSIDQIVTYRALDEYHEPEWVTELVEQGKLPPVEERLPVEPQVILKTGMPDGIGVYGDSWRDFSACPTAGWNVGAGVTAGWFGIESMSHSDGSLVQTGPLFRANQDIEPFPQLAKSWEWSEDGKQLTMQLIEGAKWSDGQPFTADDVMFTWEDLILDPNVVRIGAKGDAWTWDGEQATLEKVDDYTIRWTFPVERPLEKFYLMDEQDFSISPAHILRDLHPKYNTATDYKEFENALPPDLLPQVTMGPWAAVEYRTDELLVMRRNPYYWKVDEEGNQLPYIDEAIYRKGPSGVGRTLCTLAGDCDHTNLENPASEFVEALQRAQEPDAHFTMNWGPELLAFGLQINQSESLGVQDDRDRAVRALFREDKFRQALSHAIDREGITQSIMRGPFLRPWAGGLYPGSPEFDRSAVIYYPFNQDLAKQLLAELGFEDTDGNGTLNWPADGPMGGDDLVLAMTASQDAQETVNTAESLVAMFGQVGIQINLRPQTSQALIEQSETGEWEMNVFRGDQEFALPFTRCTDLAPLTADTPNWNREGDTPRVLRDWEQELVDIVNEYCVETDAARRKDLINQYNRIFTEHNYHIGIFVGRYGLALAKRFQNVPGGTPTFLYQWVEDAMMSEMTWTPVDQQREQVRPNVIPEYTN
jgi:peptide/nickel transport system substrate-binding protein